MTRRSIALALAAALVLGAAGSLALGCARRTRLVAKARIDPLAPVPDEAGRSRFQKLAAAGWLSLSAVVISPDRLDALVAFDAHCGGPCGEGGYAWVRWNESAGRWILVRTFARWFLRET
jgi:hypothetical protein